MQKLDAEYAIEGFVLGDSMYSIIMADINLTAYDWEILECEALGNVIVPFVDYRNRNRRYIYGTKMDEVKVGALNGQICSYSFVKWNADKTTMKMLKDSLETKYGEATACLDTSYIENGDSLHISSYIWQGAKVYLIYSSSNLGTLSIQLADINVLNLMGEIFSKVDAFAEQSNTMLDSLTHVGKFNLYMEKGEALKNYKVNVEKGESIYSYRINYDEYLEPFFGIENKTRYYHDAPAITASLNFSEETDSLTRLTISFDKEVEGKYSWQKNELTNYSEILSILNESFGEYSFEEELRTKTGVYHRAFWINRNISIILEEDRITDQIDVSFLVRSIPIL